LPRPSWARSAWSWSRRPCRMRRAWRSCGTPPTPGRRTNGSA
jgi:hypothetical protein